MPISFNRSGAAQHSDKPELQSVHRSRHHGAAVNRLDRVESAAIGQQNWSDAPPLGPSAILPRRATARSASARADRRSHALSSTKPVKVTLSSKRVHFAVPPPPIEATMFRTAPS